MQHVIIEAIFFIPQRNTLASQVIHCMCDQDKMLKELAGHIFINRIDRGQLHGDVEHVQAEHAHPTGSIGLFDVPPIGSLAERSKTPMLSSPKKPPSKTFMPSGSLRFTHQVKFKRSLCKTRSRKAKSALPRIRFSILYTRQAAQAWTGGFTSLKFHS